MCIVGKMTNGKKIEGEEATATFIGINRSQSCTPKSPPQKHNVDALIISA